VVTATLEELPARAGQAAIAPPAVVIVGPTVALHESLNWVESLPLHGRCVLVTRSQPQASVLSQTLHRLGAEVIEAPSIRIEPPAQLSGLDAALRDAGGYDWLVLTSPNGVKAVMDRMAAMGMDVRSLAGPKIAVIGRATAERLAAYHITADLVPETFTSQALGDALLARKPTGQRMLLARSDLAPDTLARRLRAAGATVEDIVAYRTVRPQALPTAAADALYANRVDWITFTSSSTVENLLAIKGELDLSTFRLAAIGPVTADALRGVGLEPMVVATPHTIDGLVESIVRWEDDLADA
jgi:uroporphyrinogen III methyltransferase/synthase